MSNLEDAGRTLIRGVSRDKLAGLEGQIEEKTASVKSGGGRRIESLAAQIRRLGDELESPAEAGRLARELERTADYLRYRRTTDIAGDIWHFLASNRGVWVAGAFLGAAVVYAALRWDRESQS